MDGLEATKDIRLSGREDAGSVPIIAMMADAFDGESRQSIRSGMNGHCRYHMRAVPVLRVRSFPAAFSG